MTTHDELSGRAPPRGGRGGLVVPATRVIVADDDVLLREGLAGLLERAGMEVGGRADDGQRLLSQARALRPDLVVVDIRMPPTQTPEGLGAAHESRRDFPDIGILVLSAHVEVEHAMGLL